MPLLECLIEVLKPFFIFSLPFSAFHRMCTACWNVFTFLSLYFRGKKLELQVTNKWWLALSDCVFSAKRIINVENNKTKNWLAIQSLHFKAYSIHKSILVIGNIQKHMCPSGWYLNSKTKGSKDNWIYRPNGTLTLWKGIYSATILKQFHIWKLSCRITSWKQQVFINLFFCFF